MENYEILRTIGEGTYGIVLQARQKETGAFVAIKKFKESDEDEQVRKTALREVRLLKQLTHDNIVSLIEVFRRKGKLYLVFEFVESTILEEIEKFPSGIGKHDVKRRVFQLLRAIEYCHQNNIIHRDIKPENLLVSRHGILKLCDFGFARPLGGAGCHYTDYVATRWYRSPELLAGDTQYGRGVDIWAIGCMVAEMATGMPLFPGESDVDQLFHIMRCLGPIPRNLQEIISRNPLFDGVKLPRISNPPPEPLEKRFSRSFDPQLLQLMQCCFSHDPEKRSSCTELLALPYFEGFAEEWAADYERITEAEQSSNKVKKRSKRKKERREEEPDRDRAREMEALRRPQSTKGSERRAPAQEQEFVIDGAVDQEGARQRAEAEEALEQKRQDKEARRAAKEARRERERKERERESELLREVERKRAERMAARKKKEAEAAEQQRLLAQAEEAERERERKEQEKLRKARDAERRAEEEAEERRKSSSFMSDGGVSLEGSRGGGGGREGRGDDGERDATSTRMRREEREARREERREERRKEKEKEKKSQLENSYGQSSRHREQKHSPRGGRDLRDGDENEPPASSSYLPEVRGSTPVAQRLLAFPHLSREEEFGSLPPSRGKLRSSHGNGNDSRESSPGGVSGFGGRGDRDPSIEKIRRKKKASGGGDRKESSYQWDSQGRKPKIPSVNDNYRQGRGGQEEEPRQSISSSSRHSRISEGSSNTYGRENHQPTFQKFSKPTMYNSSTYGRSGQGSVGSRGLENPKYQKQKYGGRGGRSTEERDRLRLGTPNMDFGRPPREGRSSGNIDYGQHQISPRGLRRPNYAQQGGGAANFDLLSGWQKAGRQGSREGRDAKSSYKSSGVDLWRSKRN